MFFPEKNGGGFSFAWGNKWMMFGRLVQGEVEVFHVVLGLREFVKKSETSELPFCLRRLLCLLL